MESSTLDIKLTMNRFRVNCKITLLEKDYNLECIVDTGAVNTLIRLSSFGLNYDERMIIKSYFIKNNYKFGVLQGVEGSNRKLKVKDWLTLTYEEKLKTKGIIFYCSNESFSLNGVKLSNKLIAIDCDTDGVNLIGMSTLKDFQITIGVPKTSTDNEPHLVACKADNLSTEYCTLMDKYFSLSTQHKHLSEYLRKEYENYRLDNKED